MRKTISKTSPDGIVFDLGGSNLRIARVDRGKVSRLVKVATPATEAEGMVVIARVVGRLMAGARPASIVGGVAGTLDASKTKLLRAPNLPGWVGQPLKKHLQRISSRVVLENDAVLAGLAEARLGSGRGVERVAFITVGTGVGGCLIVNGKSDRRTYGDEPGRWKIGRGGERRAWEAWISGAAIRREYHRAAVDVKSSHAWRELRSRCTLGLEEVCARWRPDIIILGGSVMKRLWSPAWARKWQTTRPHVELRRSQYGDQTTLIGAIEVGNNISE